MVSIRRWYVYLVNAITLQSVAWAFIALLRKLFLGETNDKEVIALQIAVIVVALPLFLVHWFWGQRLAGREPDERSSFPRRLYLYGMLAGFLVPIIYNGNGVIHAIFNAVLGVEPGYTFTNSYSNGEMIVFGMTAVVVLAIGLAYHLFVTWWDNRVMRESDSSAVLCQLHIYSFSMIGLVMGAIGAGRLLERLTGPLFSDRVLRVPLTTFLATEITRFGVGLVVWLVFWWLGQRAFSGPDERERESVVRKAYLYLLVFIGAVGVISTAIILLTNALERLFGLGPDSSDLNSAVAIILVCGAIWAYHAFVIRRDAKVAEEVGKQAMVRRIYTYLMAGLGLGAFLIGLAGILTVLLEELDDELGRFDFREGISVFLAMIVVGLIVWRWHWRRVSQEWAVEPSSELEERRSFVRRLYFYFYIFVATLTLLGSVIFIVSQILMLLLGARTGDGLLVDLGQALSYTMIAVVIWIYHGRIIRQDGRLVDEAELAQLKRLNVAVVDTGDGLIGRAIAERLREKVPGAIVHPVGLSETAVLAMEEEEAETEAVRTPLELLAEAEVIVGPWSMMVPAGNGGTVSADAAALITASPARKILLPEPGDGYNWVGVERWAIEDIAKEVAEDVRALTLGEELADRRGLAAGVVVLIALVSLCLLAIIIPVVIGLFTSGF